MATYGEALRQAAAAEDGLAPVADVDERRRVLTSILRDGTNPEKLRAAQLLGMIEGDYAPELAKKRGRREMEDAFEALVSKAPGLGRRAGVRAKQEPERGLEVPEASDNGSDQDSEVLDPEWIEPDNV
jgi:hypothetical protein